MNTAKMSCVKFTSLRC